MDLSSTFVLTLAVAGVILAADRMLFKARRQRGAEGMVEREPLVVYYARSFFPVVLIVLLLRSFVFEPFRIPSASISPCATTGLRSTGYRSR